MVRIGIVGIGFMGRIHYLAAQRGRHFDPRLADAFVSLRKEIMDIQSEWQDPAPVAASS